MPDRAPDTHSAPATSSLAQKITEVKSRERRSAVSFLRDTVGCLIRETPIPHLQRVIADGIKIFCDFGKEQVIVQINGYDLGHTVTGFQFRYLGQRDFPVCSLVFKPRALAIDSEAPVFREDEYLMRAGIVLEAQSDYTRVFVKTGARDVIPGLVADYTEDRLVLNIGGIDLSRVAVGFVLGANLPSRAVSLGSLGLRFQ